MHGRFAKRKVTRWGGRKAGFHCIDKWYLFKFPAMRAVKIEPDLICGKSQMIVDFTVFQPSQMVGKTIPDFTK